MPGLELKSWPDNPNAPKIPYMLYLEEKTWFAGVIICSVLYGMLTVLFFKCMAALFNPAYRRGEGIKWGFVLYTVVMFSLATVVAAMNTNIFSISFVDNREFLRDFSGPVGYVISIYNEAINMTPNIACNLNNWLADGLLLYRCYLIYSKNLWAIAFPCLIYLGSVGTYLNSPRAVVTLNATAGDIATGILGLFPWYLAVGLVPWNVAYFSISLSLNVIVTLMIVIRLVLHGRNIRTATGSPDGIGELYRAVATMFVESSALFSASLLLAAVSWGTSTSAVNISWPILSQTQVIAPLLIIQRVASKSALTGNTIPPGSIRFFKSGDRGELTGGSDTIPGEDPMRSADGCGVKSSGESGVRAETVIDLYREKV